MPERLLVSAYHQAGICPDRTKARRISQWERIFSENGVYWGSQAGRNRRFPQRKEIFPPLQVGTNCYAGIDQHHSEKGVAE